jgi:IS5 family transposase
VLAQWAENDHWQHFSGRQFFEHELPIHPSSLSRWRKRLGKAEAVAMLKATIHTGLKRKVITSAQIERVNVATTVQR